MRFRAVALLLLLALPAWADDALHRRAARFVSLVQMRDDLFKGCRQRCIALTTGRGPHEAVYEREVKFFEALPAMVFEIGMT